MPRPEDRADGGIAEHLAFEPVSREKPGQGWRWPVAFILLAGILAGSIWIFWGKSLVTGQNQGDIPFVQANPAPIKQRPADPGGMEVPDRDKLVYRAINGETAGSRVERLLPPPEEPLPLPGTARQAEPRNEATRATRTDSTGKQSTQDANARPAAQTQFPQAFDPAPAPARKPASPQPVAGTYRIQLAALRSHARAVAEWTRLQNAHTDLLGTLERSVVRVDLGGERGVFYRLRAGPLNDAEAAGILCSKLGRRDVNCLVVLPGS